jgi:hypothetical protein
MSCDCALRSFWDGPCEEHTRDPKLLDPVDAKKFSDYGAAVSIEWNKMLDPIIEQAAIELGWAAGHSVKFNEPES